MNIDQNKKLINDLWSLWKVLYEVGEIGTTPKHIQEFRELELLVKKSNSEVLMLDKNGIEITTNSWLKCDDDHYKTTATHYVFWNKKNLCYDTIKFCEGNPKLDYNEGLWRMKTRNPVVIEKPDWITEERMKNQLKYYE